MGGEKCQVGDLGSLVIIRCVLSKWDYFVKKENLILGLKIKTRTNKEEQKININYLYK